MCLCYDSVVSTAVFTASAMSFGVRSGNHTTTYAPMTLNSFKHLMCCLTVNEYGTFLTFTLRPPYSDTELATFTV